MRLIKLIGLFLPLLLLLTSCNMTLHRAAGGDDLTVVKKVLQDGADINERNKGWTPLMLATYYNRIAIAEYLIENGADINLQKSQYRKFTERFDGFTALHFAAFYGNSEIARILINSGADLSIRDSNGMMARDYARQYSFMKIVELIDKAGEKKE